MKRPVVAIIQARMGASRLPNKMMLWLHGLPVVEWVFRRVSMANGVDQVVFALPDTQEDDILANHLKGIGAVVFRGSETDVLGRCCQAASLHGAGTIVRICADNPFVTASEIDRLIDFFRKGDFDYAYNHIPRNNCYPDGLGAEIVPFPVLERLNREAGDLAHREHMFNYIWDNQSAFRIGTCDPLDESLAFPELKLDLDTTGDYDWLLQLPVHPGMSAQQVVSRALACPKKTKGNNDAAA